MNNNLNIEDFFRESFDGHSVEPKSKVWSGISKKLWKRQFGDFFKFSFEGYQINPSANIWASIARKLWFYNFLRFNPASFNVYYLGLAVSVVTGIMISSNLNSNGTIALQDKSIILNNNNSTVIKNQQNLTVSNTDNGVSIDNKPVLNNTSETKNNSQVVPINTNNINQNQNLLPIKNKINNQVTINTKKNNTITAPAFFKDQGLNNIKENSNDQKFTALNPDAEKSKNTQNKVSSDNIENMLLSMLQPKNSMLPLSKGNDILIPDTVGYDFNWKPIIMERVHWSVDAWWSPIYSRSLFTTNTPELKEYEGILKNAASDDITYTSYGGDLNYSYKSWVFQIGVSYAEFGQKMKVPNTISDIRQNSYYNYFENNFLQHDTIWFIDLDSLLQNPLDTFWIPKPIETWIYQKDSNLVTLYDTLKTTNHHTVSNRYSYLEIPIMAGYEIRKGKFSYAVKGGVAAGFFIRSSGSIPAQNGYESISLSNSNLPYIKPNFTLLFSVGINYHLNDKIAVFGEPYIRKNINSIFENRYIYSQKFQGIGVKFGVKYTFK